LKMQKGRKPAQKPGGKWGENAKNEKTDPIIRRRVGRKCKKGGNRPNNPAESGAELQKVKKSPRKFDRKHFKAGSHFHELDIVRKKWDVHIILPSHTVSRRPLSCQR
jgi:hypothetical protein